MNLTAWRSAAILGALGVALGAFGAHGLEDVLDAAGRDRWDTAAHYHLVHAVALGLAAAHPARPRAAAIAFTVGIVVFSGSLYALALTSIGWLGAITPIGGLAFIIGWLLLGTAASRDAGRKSNP